MSPLEWQMKRCRASTSQQDTDSDRKRTWQMKRCRASTSQQDTDSDRKRTWERQMKMYLVSTSHQDTDSDRKRTWERQMKMYLSSTSQHDTDSECKCQMKMCLQDTDSDRKRLPCECQMKMCLASTTHHEQEHDTDRKRTPWESQIKKCLASTSQQDTDSDRKRTWERQMKIYLASTSQHDTDSVRKRILCKCQMKMCLQDTDSDRKRLPCECQMKMCLASTTHHEQEHDTDRKRTPWESQIKRCLASTSRCRASNSQPKQDTDTKNDTDRKEDTDTNRKEDIDRNKKKRRHTYSQPQPLDRFTVLPDQTLGQILSLFPTKDVAAMQLMSKGMRHALSLVTSLDFDDSPICHSEENPHLVERFPLFKSFVDDVLHKLSRSDADKRLTRFRLRLGSDYTKQLKWSDSTLVRLPYLEPACLNGWISYPLAHSGLRDLDLTFHIRNRTECKLPPQLFACRSLESFRLDANILIDDAVIPPLICLPNLKLLHIYSVIFTGDDFFSRLVSSCPALENLSIYGCYWEKMDRVIMSSHSLRRLVLGLMMHDEFDEDIIKMSDLVLIDTPNLEYLWYYGELAYRYSVTHMNALVEASVEIVNRFEIDNLQTCFRILLGFLSALSNVQHLHLRTDLLELISSVPELKDELPMFRNLRTIKLSHLSVDISRWDILLPMILRSSPLLETLVFPEGLRSVFIDGRKFRDPREEEAVIVEEVEGWRKNQTIPSCFMTHLTRIEFGSCDCLEHEANLIKFVLSKASALKELVISFSKRLKLNARQLDEFVNKLKELPRASNSCSIIVDQ